MAPLLLVLVYMFSLILSVRRPVERNAFSWRGYLCDYASFLGGMDRGIQFSFDHH